MFTTIETEIAGSRKKILDALDRTGDITLIRGYGNLGDELIFAGMRQLLGGVRYRETGVDNLYGVRGELGLVAGGGAWCGEFDYMAKLLPEIERRFARVIVLPSSYDPNVDAIRRILAQSHALFFARERTSYDLIRGICRAELAHDGAFFFDYRPYRISPHECDGMLVSFRTDAESTGGAAPPENEDISITRSTLDEWLWTISRCETVRTDRAHVMIAGAMLGKLVEYRATKYHKLPAIADYALRSLPVRNLDRPAAIETLEKLRAKSEAMHCELPERYRQMDVDRLVTTVRRETLTSPTEIAGALQGVATRYVLLLDAGVEPLPGAVERLLRFAEEREDCAAVTGALISSHGIIIHSGADIDISDAVMDVKLSLRGLVYDEPIRASGACAAIPPGWALVDAAALGREPLDLNLAPDLDLIDWSMRIAQSGCGRLYRTADALAVMTRDDIREAGQPPGMPEWLSRYALFYKRHNLVPGSLFDELPGLGPRAEARVRAAARLLLAMVADCGVDWVGGKWEAGDLTPLFPALSGRETELLDSIQALRQELEQERGRFEEIRKTRAWKLLTLQWRLRAALREKSSD